MPSRSPRRSLLYSTKRLELAVRVELDAMLRGSGITTPQFTALTVLADRDGISAADLARASFVTPQSMGDMLGRLESHGLAQRSPSPVNHREVTVRITAAGLRVLDRYEGHVKDIEDRMTVGMTDEQVNGALHVMVNAWERLH